MRTRTIDVSPLASRGLGLASLAMAGCLAGCGLTASRSAEAPDESAEAANSSQGAHSAAAMSTSAAMGGLNEDQSRSSFYNAKEGIERCIAEGARRLEFLEGSIELAVEIDATRRAVRAWSSHSTLGDRATERCMFDALLAVQWPRPEGGPYSVAKNSFEFSAAPEAPRPTVWDAARVGESLRPLAEPLSECRGGATGEILFTLYIDPVGHALSGGAAHPRSVPNAVVDCMLEHLLAQAYPAPGTAPAKVLFRL